MMENSSCRFSSQYSADTHMSLHKARTALVRTCGSLGNTSTPRQPSPVRLACKARGCNITPEIQIQRRGTLSLSHTHSHRGTREPDLIVPDALLQISRTKTPNMPTSPSGESMSRSQSSRAVSARVSATAASGPAAAARRPSSSSCSCSFLDLAFPLLASRSSSAFCFSRCCCAPIPSTKASCFTATCPSTCRKRASLQGSHLLPSSSTTPAE
jgi:hypothetical protein